MAYLILIRPICIPTPSHDVRQKKAPHHYEEYIWVILAGLRYPALPQLSSGPILLYNIALVRSTKTRMENICKMGVAFFT